MILFKGKLGYLLEAILGSIVLAIIIPTVYLLRIWVGDLPPDPMDFKLAIVFTFSVSFCIYYFNISVSRYIRDKKYFSSEVTRVIVEIIITTFLSAIVMFLVLQVFMLLSSFRPPNLRSAMYDNIIIAIIVNLVVLTLMEVFYFFNKWKLSLIESEQLRRQNAEIQYAALSNQINPHFLFNSLNVLTSLIREDQDRAILFTEKFSRIYRYVLDSREKVLVRLEEELGFINSFFYLQKLRFDKSLLFKTDIDVSCFDYLLPPLSLQLLVENAIKHNEISEHSPLQINISGSGKELVVSNNYQPKENDHKPGIGLKNLTERYSHFTDIVPEFRVEDGFYIAKIPLIEDE